jgi:hypothetical protein
MIIVIKDKCHIFKMNENCYKIFFKEKCNYLNVVHVFFYFFLLIELLGIFYCGVSRSKLF